MRPTNVKTGNGDAVFGSVRKPYVVVILCGLYSPCADQAAIDSSSAPYGPPGIEREHTSLRRQHHFADAPHRGPPPSAARTRRREGGRNSGPSSPGIDWLSHALA